MVMTKSEIINEMKKMFIDKFGAGVEVELEHPIEVAYSWDVGSTMLSKIRYNGETNQFEWYRDFWNSGWETTQNQITNHAISIFSDALGLKVGTKTDYFFK